MNLPRLEDDLFLVVKEKILFHWCGASYFSVIDRVEGDSIKIVAVDFGDEEITDKYRDDMEKDKSKRELLYWRDTCYEWKLYSP